MGDFQSQFEVEDGNTRVLVMLSEDMANGGT